MANSLALLVQQREMTAAEIADERKAAEALQHSPLVAKYLPGQPIGPHNKHAWNDKALKTVKAWEHKQAAKMRWRKKLPEIAKSENIEGYLRARRRAYD